MTTNGSDYTCSGASSPTQTVDATNGNVDLDSTFTTLNNNITVLNESGGLTVTQDAGSSINGNSTGNTRALDIFQKASEQPVTVTINGAISGTGIGLSVTSLAASAGKQTLIIGKTARITGTDMAVFITTSDGPTPRTIINEGTIKTQLGNFAVLSTGGTEDFQQRAGLIEGTVALGDYDDVMTASGGAIKGAIYMGNDTDVLNLGGTFDASGLVAVGGNNGTDTLNISDIVVNGYTAASNNTDLGTNIQTWENINLKDNATLKLNGNLFTSAAKGNLTIASNATLNTANNGTGAFSVFGDVANNSGGNFSMRDGNTGDVTTITGNYTGNGGTVWLDTGLDGDGSPTDLLAVTGNVSGTSGLYINPVGGVGEKTDKGIEVIKIGGTSAADAFKLSNSAPLEIGAYVYNLTYYGGTDQNWYLTSDVKPDLTPKKPDVGTIGETYEAASGLALNDLFVAVPTLEQRVGQRQWASRKEETGSEISSGFWVRGIGDYERFTPKHSDAKSTSKSWRFGTQAGLDLVATNNRQGVFVLGVTGQYLSSHSRIKNHIGHGRVDSNLYGGGLTATWYGSNGFYADAQAQVNHIRQKYKSETYGSLKKHQGRTGFATSHEMGYKFAITQTMRLVPQAQFVWGHVDDANFNDAMGNDVKLHRARGGQGRAGLAYEYEFSNPTSHQTFGDYRKAYGIGNVVHDFKSRSRATISADGVGGRNDKTFAEVGLGGTLGRNQAQAVFVEANYRTKLGGHGSNHGFGATAGFRFNW